MPRHRRKSLDFSLDSETRRGIFVLILFAFAVFLFLGMFDMAGAIGRALDDGISYVFGWDRIVIPVFLMVWGYYMVAPTRLPIRVTNVIGMLLFFLSLNPLMHAATFPKGGQLDDRVLAAAGGKLGETIAGPIVNMLGLAGTITVLAAIFLVSLLLIFNATLHEVLFIFRWAGKALILLAKFLSSPFVRMREKRVLAPYNATNEPQPATLANVPTDAAGMVQAQLKPPVGMAVRPIAREEEEEEEPPKPRKHYPRIEIPLDLLERRDQKPTSGDIYHNRETIRRTLETFGIPVEMAEVSVGPTVTQFSLKPSDGIKLTRITALHNDLALALAAHPIRIEAPIPGKSLVGIEVPNQTVATVGLREILESREFRDRKTAITFALGKDVAGKPWVADLNRMPHLLVAGATGSGKSVCLNAVIMSFLYANGPDDLKFILVDPKRVELQMYNGIPHLITPVITKVNETVNALKWALREMDRRYDLLSKFGARDIAGYNERQPDKLPTIVIVVDELADLMVTAQNDIEGPIVRLCQMARAVGIHLVVATQRPSVDVITGLIKANIPARIAFAVASAMDSRTILDQQGAEKLLGRGDMLFSTAELASPKRIQGCFISEAEIVRVVQYLKSHSEPPEYDPSVIERPSASSGSSLGSGYDGGYDDGGDSDALLPDAKEEIMRAGKASASLLQRRLKVGYARAARILDLLEQEGFIGPGDGAKPREILNASFSRQTEETGPPTPTAFRSDVELSSTEAAVPEVEDEESV